MECPSVECVLDLAGKVSVLLCVCSGCTHTHTHTQQQQQEEEEEEEEEGDSGCTVVTRSTSADSRGKSNF